jgi:hypothetical protein
MARPFPLIDPQGRVWRWVCGRCGHLGRTGERLVELDGPQDFDVECSLADATRCCTCNKCGVEMGMAALLKPRVCSACRPAHDAMEAERLAKYAADADAFRERRDASLAKCPNVGAAIALEMLMSQVSEEHYCAGWMSGLEFSLWWMLEDSRDYGAREVSESDLARLRDLHEACGGWWHWQDHEVHGAVFVQTAEWLALFTDHVRVVTDLSAAVAAAGS